MGISAQISTMGTYGQQSESLNQTNKYEFAYLFWYTFNNTQLIPITLADSILETKLVLKIIKWSLLNKLKLTDKNCPAIPIFI